MTNFDRLLKLAQPHYQNGDPAHDFAHIQRVMENARRLGLREGADLEILLPAALLHDVVNLPKDHPERARASEMAAEKAKDLLQKAEYSSSQIERIQAAILDHSYSRGSAPSSKEAAVLQDADRLDALGAIGLLRMITVGGKLGREFYDVQDPMASRRELDDRSFTIDHFGTKLFKLADRMNTSAAREEALRRTQYMRDFLSQLQTEIAPDLQKNELLGESALNGP